MGCYPLGSLILAGSRLYGVTYKGGIYDSGCIFSIDTDGSGYKDMFDFNRTSGYFPSGSLILLRKVLYGMTKFGGANDSGVIFGFKDTNISNSINELATNSDAIKVYPNPSKGVFKIQLPVGSGQLSVEVYNMLGEKVYTTQAIKQSQTINLTGQPKGVYFYRVIAENGSFIGEGKEVIMR
jgi:uncharacterized repeat protein (TIGR03803 family)